jgi:hypothetical protein
MAKDISGKTQAKCSFCHEWVNASPALHTKELPRHTHAATGRNCFGMTRPPTKWR